MFLTQGIVTSNKNDFLTALTVMETDERSRVVSPAAWNVTFPGMVMGLGLMSSFVSFTLLFESKTHVIEYMLWFHIHVKISHIDL